MERNIEMSFVLLLLKEKLSLFLSVSVPLDQLWFVLSCTLCDILVFRLSFGDIVHQCLISNAIHVFGAHFCHNNVSLSHSHTNTFSLIHYKYRAKRKGFHTHAHPSHPTICSRYCFILRRRISLLPLKLLSSSFSRCELLSLVLQLHTFHRRRRRRRRWWLCWWCTTHMHTYVYITFFLRSHTFDAKPYEHNIEI